MDFKLDNLEVCIIGLGYVGFPLAIEIDKKYKTIGFDINPTRINDLRKFEDTTKEVSPDIISKSNLKLTSDEQDIKGANIYIVTVPTPIDSHNKPDLNPLKKATKLVGQYIKKNDIVIYESTVFPGCTEEVCVPLLEKESKLEYNVDFFCGYSPERINPGDKVNTITSIKKVTSGSNNQIGIFVDSFYKSIIDAGTYLAPSIKVAEASKIIENTQRDINISFVNELSLIFDKMEIDTNEVLEAARTKWNFLDYKPGLVGGHCISVDPYYLSHKSESLGYYPEVILSGRRVNSEMSKFIASKVMKLMNNKKINLNNARLLLAGFTFKENCPDIRNTKVVEIYTELLEYGLSVDVFDTVAIKEDVLGEYGISILNELNKKSYYDALIIAVPHKSFYDIDFKSFLKPNSVIFDVKGMKNKDYSDSRL